MTLSTTDPGSLLSAPLTSGVRAETRFSRPSTEQLGFINTSQQFRIENSVKNYNSQFFKVRIFELENMFLIFLFQVYNARLEAMRPLIIEAAKDKFGDDVDVKPLVELKADDEEERKENILIIGTIFKQQEKKPSILAELSEEAGVEVIIHDV